MTRLLLLVVLLAGCAAPPVHPDDPPQPTDASVYILLHEWHTEISVPAGRLTGGLTRFQSIFPDAAYLSFGFGERLYFQKPHTDFIDMVEAVLPGPGTILTTALAAPPDQEYHDVQIVKLQLTQAQLDRLADFLWDSFEKTPDGRLDKLGDGKFPGYVFYAAAPTYSGFYTCNTWTMEGLDKAGLDAGAPGTLFAYQVMDRVRSLAAQASR
jgi:uncharacterized protein (TIGR02117 family)